MLYIKNDNPAAHVSYIKIEEPGLYVVAINGNMNLTSDPTKNNGGQPVYSDIELQFQNEDNTQAIVFAAGYAEADRWVFQLKANVCNHEFCNLIYLVYSDSYQNGNYLLANILEPCTLIRSIHTASPINWLPCNIYRINQVPEGFQYRAFDIERFSFYTNDSSFELREDGLYVNGQLVANNGGTGGVLLDSNTVVKDSFTIDCGLYAN